MPHVKVGSIVKISIQQSSTLILFGEYQNCFGEVISKAKVQTTNKTKKFLYKVKMKKDNNCITCLRNEFILQGDNND